MHGRARARGDAALRERLRRTPAPAGAARSDGRASKRPGRDALLALGILLGAVSCGRESTLCSRPAFDPALSAPVAAGEIDFEAARPLLVERHHAGLLTRFQGVQNESCTDELRAELEQWLVGMSYEKRRDPESWLPSRFPKDWVPSRTWSAGPLRGSGEFRYVELGGHTYCLGWKSGRLGWTSTTNPAETHWIERASSLRPYQDRLGFDVAVQGAELILVHDGAEGLREIVFRASGGQLIEQRASELVFPAGQDPVLLEVGPDLLLFWWEHTPRDRGIFKAGCALRVSRRSAASTRWAPTGLLTLDLSGGEWALGRAGDRVLVAWLDSRFYRQRWDHTVNSNKLFVSTSVDRGRSWSTPACLQDPEDLLDTSDGRLSVLSCGDRWLISTTSEEGWPRAGAAGDTLAISQDLERWAYLPGKLREPWSQIRREQIARLGR